LQNASAAKQQSSAKAPSVPTSTLQTDLTKLNALINDPNLKKWVEYGKN
jgi:hypothetical protein